jgi:hypothetical protein
MEAAKSSETLVCYYNTTRCQKSEHPDLNLHRHENLKSRTRNVGCMQMLLSEYFYAGGSGFLGQHVVKLLQEKDPKVREIRILDLKPYVKRLGK